MKRIATRRHVLLLWLLLAPGAALAAGTLGFDDARHLLNRTSFAASVDDINAFATLTREQAADRLLAWSGSRAGTPAPGWVNTFESPRRVRGMSDEERKAFQREQFEKGVELRGWWLAEMLTTPSPLTEKMVLFWHNHFTSSLQKVKSPTLMYRQNLLLRRHALGYFGDLLHEVSKDPAMVVYLDNASNRKGQPNENFAREVMELFTLGEGNYGEQDIKDAARAFTGWSIDPDSGEFLFRRPAHDEDVKTVLGRSGNFDGDAVLDILLAQPRTAEFIVTKLWREFVSPSPEPAEVRRIARMFRDNRYNIKVALRALLVSDAFYAPQNRAALVKSPIDLIVGTLRQFRFTTGEVTPFLFVSRQLGQDLFAPPNVKGWPGGDAWINSATLLARKQLLERLFRAQEMLQPAAMRMNRDDGERVKDIVKPGANGKQRFMRAMMEVHFDANRWLSQFRPGDPLLARVVLAADPASSQAAGMEDADMLRQLVLDPVYQLK